MDDKRTRRGKEMANGTSVTFEVFLDEQTAACATWGRDNLNVTVRKIDAYLGSAKLPPVGTPGKDGEEDALMGALDWD